MGKGLGKGGANNTVYMLRVFVIILNLFTSLAGLSLIGLGIYAIFRSDLLLASKTIPITMIVSGALVFAVSFLGCFGSAAESKNVLLVYFVVLMVLVVAQILVIGYGVANEDKLDDKLDQTWQRAYEESPKLIRNIEQEYACCGFRNVTDRAIPRTHPDSCVESPNFGYDQPCLLQIIRAYQEHQTGLMTAAAILGMVQILAIIAAWILLMRLPSEYQRELQYRDEHRRLVEQGKGKRGEEGADYGSTSRSSVPGKPTSTSPHKVVVD